MDEVYVLGYDATLTIRNGVSNSNIVSERWRSQVRILPGPSKTGVGNLRPKQKEVINVLIVKNAVKEAAGDKNVSSDFYEKLDEKVEDLIDRAAERAEANGRKTVQARDL